MKIVLTGGGTAGHIMPNIALLPELKKRFEQIYYIGAKDSLEEKIAKDNLIQFFPTEVVKFQRKHILNNLKIPFVLLKGINTSKKILRKLQPSVVFCKGGYVSLPTAFAAKQLNIPVICHESDMTLGLANRLICPFAAATLTSYKKTQGKGNIIYCGTPIRDRIGKGDKNRLRSELGLPDRPTLLIMGGSMGSAVINNTVIEACGELLKTYNIVHILGNNKMDYKSRYYRNICFADNIEDYFALADIVISRAGATACAELAFLKKKTLLIPLPKGSSRGDQELNAKAYREAGAAEVLPQKDLSKESLIAAIKALSLSPSPQPKTKLASNVEIASLISKYCKR